MNLKIAIASDHSEVISIVLITIRMLKMQQIELIIAQFIRTAEVSKSYTFMYFSILKLTFAMLK